MRVNVKKITSIALSTLIIIGSTSVFASSFNDVSNDYWGKPFIEKGKELGFLNGYEDGTFRPAASISRLQTIALSARLLNVPQVEVNQAKTKHQAIIKKYNIQKKADWAVGDLSVALSKGIVDEKVIGNLYNKNGAQSISTREEVTIYIAKAMGLKKEAESLKSDIALPFTDKNKIDEGAKAYVYLMEKYGIINGDNNKNFNPKKDINRAEMSKIITLAHDYMEKKKGEEVKPKPDLKPDFNLTKTITGSVFSTFATDETRHVIIEMSNGHKENYMLDKDSIVMLDGKIISASELINGLKIKVEVLEGKGNELGLIKTLSAESKIERQEGTIYDIKDTASKSLGIEYKENGSIKKNIFTLKDNVSIVLDGKIVSFSDLKVDDKVNIEIINDKISEINAIAYMRDLDGILKDINEESKYIEVEFKNGSRIKYTLQKNIDIIRNNRSSSLSDLRKGDKIRIRVQDNLITKLDAEVVISILEGKLKLKTVGYDRNEITIFNNETKKEEVYLIPKETEIFLNGELARLDEIELGDFIDIKLEGEEVVNIDAQSNNISSYHLGTISSVGLSKLEVELEGSNGQKTEVMISYTTLIEENNGRIIPLSYLKKGDGVLVTGEIYGNRIDATKISKLIK